MPKNDSWSQQFQTFLLNKMRNVLLWEALAVSFTSEPVCSPRWAAIGSPFLSSLNRHSNAYYCLLHHSVKHRRRGKNPYCAILLGWDQSWWWCRRSNWCKMKKRWTILRRCILKSSEKSYKSVLSTKRRDLWWNVRGTSEKNAENKDLSTK